MLFHIFGFAVSETVDRKRSLNSESSLYRKAKYRDRPRKLAPIVVESPQPPRQGLERKAGRQMKNEPKDALQKEKIIH